MPPELCPECGKELDWDDQDYEWVCRYCGEVYLSDDELEEAKRLKRCPE